MQDKMLELCDEDTILVGHSLENDLRACKLVRNRRGGNGEDARENYQS